jgi:hypothetical protein
MQHAIAFHGVSSPSTPHHGGGTGVAAAYGEWISHAYPWQWFVTMTSRNRTHPEALLKRFRLAVSRTERKQLGRRPKMLNRIAWVAGVERHKSGNPHLHALLWQRHDLNEWSPRSRTEFKQLLEELSGWSKVEPPKAQGSVCAYVAKYLTKDGELEFSRNYGAHGTTW